MEHNMDKKRYYNLIDMRRGVPYHATKLFLAKYTKGFIPLMNRSSVTHIIMKHAFMVRDKNEFDKWNRIFEISMNLLSGASKKDNDNFKKVFDIMTEELIHFQANLSISSKKIAGILEKDIVTREKYIRLMDVYTDLYEGFYKCIASFFAIAKKILNNKKLPDDIRIYIYDATSKKIAEFKEDDRDGCVSPVLELCEGCNNHLRNSISHTLWKLEGNKIKMWDQDPKTSKTTWKENYDIETLKDAVDSLEATVEAMVLAVIVYSYNIYKNINGYLSMSPGDYELDHIRHSLEEVAIDFGLFLNGCETNSTNSSIFLDLYIPNNLDIEQVTEIIHGSSPPRFFKVPICIMEENVNDMFRNFLSIVAGPLQSYSIIDIKVSDEKKGEIGKISITSEQLKGFKKEENSDIVKKCEILKAHTTRITIEGPSIPADIWGRGEDEELLAVWKKANSRAF